MITLGLFVALAIMQPFFEEAQGKTLFERVVAKPSGQNGYEDYLRAADVVNDGLFDIFSDGSPKASIGNFPDEVNHSTLNAVSTQQRQLRERFRTADALEIQQAAVERYGHALDLLTAGNRKPCFDPRLSVGLATTYPEIGPFRRLSELALIRAYVQRASGDVTGAVGTLLEDVTFCQRLVSSRTTMGLMTGLLGIGEVVKAFEEGLPQIDLSQAQKIQRAVDTALSEPPNLTALAESFGRVRQEQFALLREHPERLEELVVSDATLDSRLKRLTSDERYRLIKAVGALIDINLRTGGELTRWPEREWYTRSAALEATTDRVVQISDDPETLAEIVAARGLSPFKRSFTLAVLRTRTQIRLLDLHARIIEYRWRHHRLPVKLADAVPATRLGDPLSGGDFVYELQQNGTYRLYSQGRPETGPIELRYQTPSSPKSPAP